MSESVRVQRVAGDAVRLCFDGGEVVLPAAPATVDLSPEAWVAVQADPVLAAQVAPTVPAHDEE